MRAERGTLCIVLVLTRAETESVLDPDALRAALAAAMIEVSAGNAAMPARIAVVVPGRGFLAAMPAYLPGDRGRLASGGHAGAGRQAGTGGLAAKLVSQFPGNAGTAVPTHQAVVIVFDPDCGQPVALLDGTSITIARTAACSALSADLLARPGAQVAAILGTGAQARAHAHALVRVRPIRQIRLAGRDPARTAALAAELRAALGTGLGAGRSAGLGAAPAAGRGAPMGAEVHVAGSYAEACLNADIVCATTHSPEPVVRRDFLAPGVHVISVGYNTAGREVDSATVADAVVVVESRQAVLAPPPAGANDLRIPIDEGVITQGHIHAEIGELLAGTRPGRICADQITLYKSVGIAAQDIAAANLVLRRARAAGIGTEIPM